MKASGRVLFLLFISLVWAANGWAVEIRGRSSTQFLWFNDYYTGRQVDFAQYLRFSATGLDETGKFSLHGYGRAGMVLRKGDGSHDDWAHGRLYYLYGDYRDLDGVVDVKLGRHFNFLSSETAIIDGARVDVKNIGPLGFTVLGGRNVVFGLNGELGHTGDYAAGMAAYLRGFPNTDLDISWFRKWDEYDVARDILGASFKHYLLGKLKLYGNARYDLVSEVFNELLGGVKYFPTPNLSVTGEWFHSYPTFDTTSIFSVFAVNRYREGLLRADYAISDKCAVNAGYTKQSFGDDGNADVFNVGVTLRPIDVLTVGLDYDRRSGYGGDLDGVIVDVAYNATKQLLLAAGAAYDVYQRDNMTGEETARNYWVGAKYKLAKNMSASLRIEENVNKTYDSNTQGRFVFDYDF